MEEIGLVEEIVIFVYESREGGKSSAKTDYQEQLPIAVKQVVTFQHSI